MRGRATQDSLLNPLLSASLLAVLAVAPAPPAAAQDVRVSAGTIEDRRTTGRFFAGLEIELKLTGDDLAGAKAARVLVKKAVDETGRDLLPDKKQDEDFRSSFGGGPPTLKVNVKNPARSAQAVTEISGEVQLYLPERDPAATAVVDRFQSRMDKPLVSAALKSVQIEAKLVSPKLYQAELKKSQAEFEKEMEKHKAEIQKEAASSGADPKEADALMALAKGLMGMMGDVGENDVILQIKDKQKKIFEVEVVNKEGEKIDTNGSMSSGDVRILNFSKKLPADAKLRFRLNTEKSVVKAPFALKDVPLP